MMARKGWSTERPTTAGWLEEAAKMAEEKAERSTKGEHLNIPEYNFGYRGGLRGLAYEIRLKLYAKALAAMEAPQ